ncbi:uncharacterized protein LOC116546340 [Sapajus apella]|uniref:Uncharacterized protein LOC116546340 n=1 Tax=Sapajus apella TaxID=9515 RepID=A0A6J3HF36_SAPAP|nr:uncharacterized protein LOC116546340 [Sapajus apella]
MILPILGPKSDLLQDLQLCYAVLQERGRNPDPKGGFLDLVQETTQAPGPFLPHRHPCLPEPPPSEFLHQQEEEPQSGRANEAEGLAGLAQQLHPQELEDYQVLWLGRSLSGQSPGHLGPGAGRLADLRPPLLRVAGVLPSVYISGNVTLVSMLSRTGEGVWGSGGEVSGASQILPPCPSKPTHSRSCSLRVPAVFCMNKLITSFC